MLSVRLRQVLHLALALTLAVGLAAQSARAAGMTAKTNNRTDTMAAQMSIAAAGSMPMCDKCDACKNGSCKGDGCTSSGTCSAYCGNLAALLVFGSVVAIFVAEPRAIGPFRFQMGWAAPPDPYPPRTTILS
jgi:hypothetical protein